MNPNQNENELQPTEHTTTKSEKQDTIFQDLTDFSGYDKSLKKARTYLYIIAGIQLIVGIYEYATVEEYLKLWVLGIDAGIGAVFLVLALFSYKKPVLSFGLALVLFILWQVLFIYLDSANLGRGVILKIFAVIALVKGLKDAREYEEMKQTLVGEGAAAFRS